VSVLPTGSRRCPQRPVSTAEWRSRGPSGHSLSTSSPSGASSRSRRRDGAPERWIPPTGSGRPGLWRSSGLVDRQHLPQKGPGTTLERGRVPQVPGADLDEKTMSRQDRSRSVTELHMIKSWSSGGPGRVRFFIGKTVPTSQERNRCAATEPKVPSSSHNGCLTPPEQATRPARRCRCRHFPGTR